VRIILYHPHSRTETDIQMPDAGDCWRRSDPKFRFAPRLAFITSCTVKILPLAYQSLIRALPFSIKSPPLLSVSQRPLRPLNMLGYWRYQLVELSLFCFLWQAHCPIPLADGDYIPAIHILCMSATRTTILIKNPNIFQETQSAAR
jgi:hypothetical protein